MLSTPGKAFALLALIKAKPLEVRRPEQSGFTPHRSTVDRIVTLNTVARHVASSINHCGSHNVDLKSAFDSVDRELLWLFLRRHGILDKIVELLKDLYTDMCRCILTEGIRSEWF